jgi:catechol 2,3-dioxygenase-like lactoylglutathione lyase family enzyme
MEKRVTGIGGIFFKAKDPKTMYAWYEKHLGLAKSPETQTVTFFARDRDTGKDAHTYWSLFKQDTTYLDPSSSPFMINYRVDDMDAVVSALESEGVKILDRQDSEYGKFAWILDPEGNKIELFEPPKEG